MMFSPWSPAGELLPQTALTEQEESLLPGQAAACAEPANVAAIAETTSTAKQIQARGPANNERLPGNTDENGD